MKRALDVVGAAGVLVVASPILAAAAIAVRVTTGSPVMFRQQRPGLGGEPFELVKLRSMRDEAFPGEPGSQRVTSVGRFLRRTSIDELPEFWHVLRGEMSLVGPRPLLPHYNEHYDDQQARRLQVRPGITGLAQVRGRDAIDWPTKLAYDVEYLDTWSLRADIDLVIETLRLVFSAQERAAVDATTDIQPFAPLPTPQTEQAPDL